MFALLCLLTTALSQTTPFFKGKCLDGSVNIDSLDVVLKIDTQEAIVNAHMSGGTTFDYSMSSLDGYQTVYESEGTNPKQLYYGCTDLPENSAKNCLRVSG